MTNNKIRRILFITFVCLFFILSGLILPYAFGYKFNFSGLRLQRTGMFDIKTTPSGALIYLNDKKQTKFFSLLDGQESAAKTPAKLKNVIPGTYGVKLELAGYWPWNKQLSIQPGATTYLEDVYFFKKSQPAIITALNEEAVLATAASPDRQYVAILKPEQLQIWSWNKAKIIQEISLPKISQGQIAWSPSGQKIACGTVIINWHEQTTNDLKTLGIKNIKQLAWLDDNQLFFQEKNEIKGLNLKTNELTTTNFKKDINDFTVKNSELYVMSGGTDPLLSISKASNGEIISEIKLRSSERYHFLDLGQDIINLQETNSQKVYAVSAKFPWTKDYTLKEIGPLTSGQWVDKNKMIFSNNFELQIWDDNSQAKLLTRVSHTIMSMAWHKSNNYIIFATDKSLNTLELDDRDNYNILTLWESEKISHSFFNAEGTAAIFFATINSQSGFYLLEI